MARHQRVLADNARLGEAAGERDGKIRELQEQIRDLNQRRQDVSKRLDDLIGRVARLDEQFSQESAAAEVGS